MTPRRHDDSMLLLRRLVEDSLDEGYARAAGARTPEASRPPLRRALSTLGLLAVGLLLATAFAQARAGAGSAAEAKAALRTQVEEQAAANDAAQARLDRQRAAVATEQRRALQLTSAGTELAGRLSRLEAVSGAAPVAGPGIEVRLDDAPGPADGADGDPRTGEEAEGRVTDRDLQTVVNELWAAGAEALAVNGQRLTALSAIRSAGDAVLVDFRPLVPPYVIEAIGAPSTLRRTFVGGFGGSYLQVLRGFGIDEGVRDRDRVALPASAGVRLRFATVPAGAAATPAPSAAEGSTP